MSAFLSSPLTGLERAVAQAAHERDTALERAERRQRGIVHTSPELARAIVWGLHLRLQAAGAVHGLLAPECTVIDPACGPGAFVAAILALVAFERRSSGPIWAWDVDPQSVATLRALLAGPARRLGCDLQVRQQDCLRVLPEQWPVISGRVAVVGNPPWAVAARARTAALLRLIDDYRHDAAGQRLAERKLGVLADTYVCFMRLSLELVNRSAGRPAGIGLVTNSSFLDGPVHRGMRGAILRGVQEIDVADLGGNALLARRAGVRDDNVFGVRPGVAVTWALRTRSGADCSPQPAKLRAVRIWGTREAKLLQLGALAQPQLGRPGPGGEAAGWQQGRPAEPDYRMVSRPLHRRPHYEGSPSLAEAMPFHREGVQTNRDRAVVAASAALLLRRLRAFSSGSEVPDAADTGLAEIACLYQGLRHYDPDLAQRRVAAALLLDPQGALGKTVRPLAYRPFDTRFFSPIAPLCHRPRTALLEALDHLPLALLTVRKDRGALPYRHAAVVRNVPDSSYLSARSSCRTRAFPACTPQGQPNWDEQLRVRFAERAQRPVSAVDFIDYVTALLHHPRFVEGFDDLLRADYPRIPLPERPEEFTALWAAGASLRQAYLDSEGACSQPAPPGVVAEEETPVVGHVHVGVSASLTSWLAARSRVAALSLPAAWFA